MKHARITATLMLAAMLAAALSSCGGEAADTPANTAAPADPADNTVQTENVETEDLSMKDNLPEKDFGGYEYRIITRNEAWFHGAWVTEETDGEAINDAIYTRNSMVGERFNAVFSEQLTGVDKVRNVILSGDDAYDQVNTRCSISWSWAEEGLYLSLAELPYLDLSKGYWDRSLNSDLSVGGTSYFAVGASNITGYDYTHALAFNKELVKNNDLPDLYDLVKSGKWTMDTFGSVIKDISADMNGDGIMDGEDRYGYLSQAKAVLPCMWIGAEVLSVNRDKDGLPTFTMPSDTRFQNVFEKVYEVTWDTGAWFKNASVNNADDLLLSMFQENRGLFYDTTFFYMATLRGMDADFGIIPFPKFDDAQKDYHSRVEGCELSGIPITVSDPERTSILMEALASASASTVTKAYYDITLKGKSTRDEASAEMLDIIFENRIFDLGDTIWCDDLRDGVFRDMFSKNDRNIASKFASMQTKMDGKIAKSLDAFASVGK